MATTSLKDLVRTMIFDEIKKKNIPPGQSILITDEASDAILTNANCTLNELLNLGIREKLQLNATRTEKADTAAVYFLTPSLENADKVIEDSYKRLYSSAFFFLTHASDEFYEKTADRFPHGYVNGFVELANIEWIPLESRVFLTNTEHTLHDLYFTQSAADLNENIAFYAKEFQSALCAMNIDPIIKYHDPSDSQKSLSARFAYALKRQIEHYKVSIKEDHDEVYPAPTPYDQMGPSTVVIVDRSFDLISPLVHSLTYQSAAHDLFDLELVDQKGLGGKNIVFKLKSEDDETNEKLVVLDESSSVFNNLRHVFLSQAIEQVTAKIKELSDFVAPTNDIAALGERVFQATDHLLLKEQLARASDFLSLLLTKIKDEKNLMDVLKTEQDLATGAKSDGVALKREKAISKLKELFELLLDDDDKWRVLLLFVLTFGHINEKDFQELLQSAALSESTYPMLRGFSFFGYDPTIDSSYTLASKDAVTPGKSKFAAWKSLFGGAKQNSQATAAEEKEFIEYARHEPRLTKILTEHLTTRLNPMEFRTVRDVKLEEEERITGSRTIKRSGTPENGKSAVKPGEGVILDFKSTNFAPKWGRARPRPPADLGGDFRDNGPKTVVIVLGGLTYTEVRECYLVGIQNEREVFIGSTEMLSADSFMDVLLEFGRSSVNPLNVLEAPLPIPEKPVITLNEDATVSNFELTSQSIFSHRPATIRRRQTSSTPNLSMPYAPIDQAPPVPQIPAGVFTTKPYPGSSSANQAIQVLPQSLQQQPRVNSSASEPTQAGPTTTVPSNLPAIPTKTASIPSFTTGTYGGYEPPRRDNQQHHTYALPTSLEAQAALVEAERIRNYVPPPSGDKPIYTFIPFDQGGVNSGAGSDTAVAGLGNIASVQPKSHQPIQPPAPPPSAAASAPAVRPEPTTPAPTYMEQQKLVRQQRLLEEQKRLEQERLEKEKRAMEEEERLKQQQREEEEFQRQIREEEGLREQQKQREQQQQRQQQPQQIESQELSSEQHGLDTTSSSLPTPPALTVNPIASTSYELPPLSPTGSLGSLNLNSHSNTAPPLPPPGPPSVRTVGSRESSPTRSINSVRSGGGKVATVSDLVAISSAGMSLQTQVDKVLEMCPGFPRDIIEADLKKTGTVEVTVERIFTGILSPNPQTKPVAVPPVRVSTNPVLQNRRPQSIASPGNPSVPRPPQLNQPSYYQNYHQQQQPQQTQPGQYYNAYGQYQQQRPSQYPSYDPQATPRMESAGRPEFQATPYSYVNPATSTGQYSGPDIQTTPVMHINPSTTNSQYNGTPASQVLGQPTQTSPQSQPANLSQQLPPPPAGMQYVMYNGQYYIQHIVAQPVRPQTIGYPVQQQLPQRPTSSLSSYSGQGGFYPQPPRPQGYPQQPVMQPTQQSYHNPSPAPPQVNQTYQFEDQSINNAPARPYYNPSSSQPPRVPTPSQHPQQQGWPQQHRPPAGANAPQPPTASVASTATVGYPLIVNAKGEVQDPVPTWTGSWPLILTGQKVAYQKCRTLYLQSRK